ARSARRRSGRPRRRRPGAGSCRRPAACASQPRALARGVPDVWSGPCEPGATAVTLLFMLRRENVLNVLPRDGDGRLAKTAAALQTLYPLLLLLLAAVILLHVFGFTALASYIGCGLAATAAALLAAPVAYYAIRDVVTRIVRLIERSRAQPASSEATDLPPAPRAVMAALRWSLAVAVTVIILRAWGIQPYEIKTV